MAREVEAAVQTLIDSGHCGEHRCVDVVLTDGTELHLATGERLVGATQYLGRLGEVSPLKTSLDAAADATEFEVANADMSLGQALATSTPKLDGAEAVLGKIFEDPDTGALYHDPQVPGELVAGPIGERAVTFTFVSDVDVAVVSGRTVGEVFPFKNQLVSGPTSLPEGPGGRGGGSLRPDTHTNDELDWNWARWRRRYLQS